MEQNTPTRKQLALCMLKKGGEFIIGQVTLKPEEEQESMNG
jgi:hypothetical protein